MPHDLFISYAKEDENFLSELERHLQPLEQRGLITVWHRRRTPFAVLNKHTLRMERLAQARLILCLVSADYLATMKDEFDEIVPRQAEGATIRPILVRPVWLQGSFIGTLDALPANAKPIASWESRDAAWSEVVGAIAALLGERVSPDQRAAGQRIKVLFLATNPHSTTWLRLGEEAREIRERILRGQSKRLTDSTAVDSQDLLEFHSECAVRTDDLAFLLQQHQAQILHISAHGTDEGELIFQNEAGEAVAVSAATLSRLLSVLKNPLRCVVLNACWSASLLNAVLETADCAIGMSRLISDKTATLFAAGFYQALALGQSVQTAFALGRLEAEIAGQPDHDIPMIHFRKGVDPAELYLVRRAVGSPPR